MVSRKRGRESFGQAFTLGQRPHYIRILESFSDSESPSSLNGSLNFLRTPPLLILFSTLLETCIPLHRTLNDIHGKRYKSLYEIVKQQLRRGGRRKISY